MTVRTDIYMTVCVKAFPLTDKDVLSSPLPCGAKSGCMWQCRGPSPHVRLGEAGIRQVGRGYGAEGLLALFLMNLNER